MVEWVQYSDYGEDCRLYILGKNDSSILIKVDRVYCTYYGTLLVWKDYIIEYILNSFLEWVKRIF